MKILQNIEHDVFCKITVSWAKLLKLCYNKCFPSFFFTYSFALTAVPSLKWMSFLNIITGFGYLHSLFRVNFVSWVTGSFLCSDQSHRFKFFFFFWLLLTLQHSFNSTLIFDLSYHCFLHAASTQYQCFNEKTRQKWMSILLLGESVPCLYKAFHYLTS